MLQKADNFDQYLMALGVPKDVAIGTQQFRPTIDITHFGDDVEMLSTIGNGYGSHKIAFTIGKDCTWTVYGATGAPYRVKFEKDGSNQYSGTYEYNGHKGTTSFQVLNDRLIQTYRQGHVHAMKEYKRI